MRRTPTIVRSISGGAFSALKVPAYRWLLLNAFFGAAVWTVERIGQGWLVLQLTDSPFWVGVAFGVRGIFQLIFSIVGGAVADRFDRRNVILLTYLEGAVTGLIVAALIVTDTVRLWHILLASAVGGAVGAAGIPATSALTYDVVGATRLLNANVFRYMANSMVRIVSALAGGVIIELLGLAPAFLFVAVAYLTGALCLLPLRSPPPSTDEGPRESPLRALSAGFVYAMRTHPVRSLLFLSLIVEAFGFSHMAMKPVMARDVLHVGATGLGMLEAAAAAGQLVAMVILAALGDFRRKEWLILGGAFSYGLTIALFGLSPWFAVSLSIVAAAGAMGGVYDSSMGTLVQTTASGEMRGRVVGIYASTWGSNQVGGFALGAVGTLIGVPFALVAAGGIVALNALRLFPNARAFRWPQAAEAATSTS